MKRVGLFQITAAVALARLLVAAGPGQCAVTREDARSRASSFAATFEIPWGHALEVTVLPATTRYGERWCLTYLGLSRIEVDRAKGAVVAAQVMSEGVEASAQEGTAMLTEQQAVAFADRVLSGMGVGAADVRQVNATLRTPDETHSRWYVTYVRTCDGIPYYDDMAMVGLDAYTGRLTVAGRSFPSAPPASKEVRMAEDAAVSIARDQAKKLGLKQVDVPPTARLQVVRPNGYWTSGKRVTPSYGSASRVAWSVAITVVGDYAEETTQKVFWIDALDGALLGGYGYRGPTSEARPAATGARHRPQPSAQQHAPAKRSERSLLEGWRLAVAAVGAAVVLLVLLLLPRRLRRR